LAQDTEQVEELMALSGVEAPEHLVGAVAPCRLETVEQEPTVVAECDQDRAPVSGIGVAGDES
jgi:hypothetical protein